MDVVTNHTADVIQLEGNAGYRNKRDFPYTRRQRGAVRRLRLRVRTVRPTTTSPRSTSTSFPYDAGRAGRREDAKNPVVAERPDCCYHNRGNTSFAGENSLYGDFFGLDDLWTERREVVEGMVDIYSLLDRGVRRRRLPDRHDEAREHGVLAGVRAGHRRRRRGAGIDDFFAFGEVFDQQFGSPFMSEFSTEGKLQSTIDFGFQLAARDFASQGGATDDLRAFFESDDYYTDADSNAYAQPTFLGNHDMGRIGYFLQRVDQVGASDAELLARSKLAHALMFFARGQPVVYYGDEQGFTGDGGDKDAREDMFANAVPVYEDNDLIGTDETTSDDNFDPYAPALPGDPAVREAVPATPGAALRCADPPVQLRRPGHLRVLADRPRRAGRVRRCAQQQRVAGDRGDPDVLAGRREVPAAAPKAARADQAHAPRPTARCSVTVPPLGFVIYRAKEPVPASDAAPGITSRASQHGDTAVARDHA